MSDTSNTNPSEPVVADKQKQRSELPRTLGFIITFVGVFFFVASFFSLLTILVLQAASSESGPMSARDIYATVLSITSILTSLGAIYIGFKLIKNLDIGRKIFNIFSLIVIAMAWGKYTYQQNEIAKSYANIPAELAAQSKGIELSDALTVFILPLILIVVALLLNLRRSKNALKAE